MFWRSIPLRRRNDHSSLTRSTTHHHDTEPTSIFEAGSSRHTTHGQPGGDSDGQCQQAPCKSLRKHRGDSDALAAASHGGQATSICRFNLKLEPTDLKFRAWVAKPFGMLPFSKLLASRRYCSVLMAANDDGIVPTSPFEPRSRFTSHVKPDTPLGIVPCRLYELNTTNLPSGQQSRSQLET